MSETPRAAADGDAATPRPNCPGPCVARTKESVRSDAHYVERTWLRFSWVAFPGLNQKTSKAGRRTDPFRSSDRPLKAEPAAALPPHSAPWSGHAARCECSVSETPRAAADGDAATPRPNCPGPCVARTKESVRSDAHYVERTWLRFSWVAFPGLNQKTSKAGRRTDPFRSSDRPLKAEPAAALPPHSAPWSGHAARCECSVSETPRAAADGDAATQCKTAHTPASPGEREGQL